MKKLLALAAAIALALTSAGWTTFGLKGKPSTPVVTVTHTIEHNGGGVVIEFIAKFVDWDKHGDRVVIDGDCDSSCTILLGIINPDHVCATERGVFGFHSASVLKFVIPTGPSIEYSLDGTRMLWFFYDSKVREALAKNDWPEPSKHPDLIRIKATDLVAPCKDKSL